MGRHFSFDDMNKNSIYFIVFFITLFYVNSVRSDVSHTIKSEIQQVFGSYALQKKKLTENKSELHLFVRSQLSPKIANAKISQYLLGNSWKNLSRNEKRLWIDTITDTLIRYSMKALESYDINAIDWNESRFEQDGSIVKLTTNVESSLKVDIPITLLIKVHEKKWGIIDITAINFSFLSLKSNEYQSFLKDNSYKELVTSLQEKNANYFCEFQACS